MSGLVRTYRILAYVVGVLLAFGALVALPTKYLLTDGSTLQRFGESADIVWMFHGFIYIAYVIATFFLWFRERWSIPFVLLVIVAGLVPLLIFWVERQVMHKLRGEDSQLERVADSAT